MQIPLRISLHGIEHSNALYNAIREEAEKFDRYNSYVTSCQVVLEHAAWHKRHGKQFTVKVDLKVPGGDIAITRQHDEALQIALGEAFEAARRKLEDYARGQRGDLKRHPAELSGRVERIDAVEGSGFIVTSDGRQLHFSRDHVVAPGFEQLSVGMNVHFLEDAGGERLQAKRVSAHGKHAA